MNILEFSHFSKQKKVKGKIKQKPEDFIVEEISYDGTILELNKTIKNKGKEGDFAYFIMQKTNWTTANAIREIGRKLNIGRKNFSYAGTKDKLAVTTQLCSVYRIEPLELEKIRIKDIKINGFWKEKEKLKLGNLIGNKFRIKITTKEKSNLEKTEKKVKEIYKELEGKFPNYFGEQRFGTTRKNTHKIGELILKNRLKDAVMLYLCDYEGEENANAVNARKELKKTLDFKNALNLFPKYLTHERTLLDALSKNPGDYANALRKLPRTILLLFVHAFQSYLFNLNLSERIEEGKIKKEKGEYYCKINKYAFPDLEIENKINEERKEKDKSWLCVKLIGYESKINKREQKLLERFQIHKDDFKVKSIPEISSKGTYRTFFAPLKDFSFKNNIFSFSLPAGSYATSVLREFLEIQNGDFQ